MTMAGGIAAAVAGTLVRAHAAAMPGVTATTLKIGQTMPYSGPASSYSVMGKTEVAFFNHMMNDQGGIAGRKIDLISLDDGYSPPRTVEDVRRLIEQEQVAFLFHTLGTPSNSAIVEYINHKKIPQLFVGSGASKWGEYKRYPWTMGWPPSYRTEAQIYAKYILRQVKDPKIAFLYQNDDFGKDYATGMRDILGKDWDKYVIKAVSYETTDPTIDSQVASLQASGANVLVVAAIPKFAAQSIRKVHDLAWKPVFIMSNVSISVGSVLHPAGEENAIGMLSTAFLKDPTDPGWSNDPGLNEWRAFMAKYLPGSDTTDALYVFAYGASQTMLQVLKQCDGDFSRENVMRQAESLRDFDCPVLLPGIKLNTSQTDHMPINTMQFIRWTGKTWDRFGDLIEGAKI
ncbi:MAG: ABC transporter substrate-binding protein [Acetobacteraceae bacterium]